jgi:hypothetical protein
MEVEATPRALAAPRPRALLVGTALVLALAYVIPYFNFTLYKFDWAFRPLGVGPMFALVLLIWPVNAVLRRLRPGLAFTGPELLLMYAMMAICAAISGEGLFVYVLVNTVHPQYYATRENRWDELFIRDVPTWLQVSRPDSVRAFYERLPAGMAVPWREWVAPIAAWSLVGFALFAGFFCFSCLLRKDWIEGQRLSFPFAAVPTELVGEEGIDAGRSLFRNRILWIGFALPVLQSLLQMAHALAPAVPYSSMYWQIGRAFGNTGPWSAISNTYAYIGFETIGILALLPAEISLSLWLFFLLNRLQLFTFAALGFGQEAVGARVFSPSAFISYQETGACLMLALILLWQSRKMIRAGFLRLLGRPAPRDPLDPLPPGAAALGLVLSTIFLLLWASRAGMDLWAFAALMAIYFGYSLAMTRMVTAGGIYVPGTGLTPRDVLVGLTGAAPYSPRSMALTTYLQHTFMVQPKVNFMHFAVNDLKVLHAGRIPGRLGAFALLLAVVLMMLVVPWTDLSAIYHRGALSLDLWQFRDSGAWMFGELGTSLYSPEGPTPYLPLGLLCGGLVMLALTWLHTNFLWWGLSPLGFIMSGTFGMNARIWTNAFVAWLLVVLLRRFGGLRLYRTWRPAFVGMMVGHLVIMALRSIIDPALGLRMQLSPWA